VGPEERRRPDGHPAAPLRGPPPRRRAVPVRRELASAKSIAAGEQYGTVYKDTRQLAEVTVSMVRALLDGAEPETNDLTSYDNGVKVVPSYLLTPMVVDADNYQQALVGTGYYTAEELG
jgi:putative multiple sugar transport system substrate-binding protein